MYLSSLSVRIHLVFREFTMNLPSSSRNYYEFTDFANLLCIHFHIHCLLRESIINSFSFSQIHHKLTIYSANSLYITLIYPEITFVYYEFTMNILSCSGIYFETNFDFANSLSMLRKYHKLRICYAITL